MTDGNAIIKKWKKTEKIQIDVDVTIPEEWTDDRLITDDEIADIAFRADLSTELEDAITPFCDTDDLTYSVISHIHNGHVTVRVYGERTTYTQEGDA